MKKKRVLVAMSGGIDSSMAALLLLQQGYEVIGITFIIANYFSLDCPKKNTSCCNLDALNDTKTVAENYKFAHYTIDVQKEFEQDVIENFIDEYFNGCTPNPCVRCNSFVKWPILLKKAEELDCHYIATGHYAQIRFENNRYILSKAKDSTKDQSYMLWGLKQEHLQKTIFPLGAYLKKNLKIIANNYPYISNVIANKRESQEICFIPNNDYRKFLLEQATKLDKEIKKGYITTLDGKIIGEHDGYQFYTIGQRKGLKIATGYPLYVVDIIPQTNTIVVGKKEDLRKKQITVKEYNLIKYLNLDREMMVKTKIRYRNPGILSSIIEKDNKIEINFLEEALAVTPGQSAVFYEGDDVIGGGIIEKEKF